MDYGNPKRLEVTDSTKIYKPFPPPNRQPKVKRPAEHPDATLTGFMVLHPKPYTPNPKTPKGWGLGFCSRGFSK